MSSRKVPADEHRFYDAETMERAVIGSMLLDPKRVSDAMFFVGVEDFSTPMRRALFECLCESPLEMETYENDYVMLSHKISRRLDGETHEKLFLEGKASQIWRDSLVEMNSSVLIAIDARKMEYYAQVVAQHGRLRRLKAEAVEAAKLAGSVDEATAMLEQAVVRAEVAPKDRPEAIGEILAREHDDLADEVEGRKTVKKVSVGLSAIDNHCGGMRGGELWVFGARPGVGKTVLGWQLALSAAFNTRDQAMFFSLEMSKSELARRMFAQSSRHLTTTKIRHGMVSDEAWDDIQKTIREHEDVPLLVIDEPRLTLTKIVATSERAAMSRKLSLIVVDYLQLMRSGGKFDNREQEVAHMSRELKALARHLDTPVVALAQLNRKVEERTSHTPQLSDLRESGSVEQDADTVVFIHRPFIFDSQADPTEAEFHIAKNRHVVGARIPLRFFGDKSIFMDHENENR